MGINEIHQPVLFAGIDKLPTPLDKRYEAMAAAEQYASDDWKREYRNFILTYLERGPATAEDIRLQYEKNGLPQPGNSKRASGAIFVRLMREKVIKHCGHRRSRIYGNDLKIYDLTRRKQQL